MEVILDHLLHKFSVNWIEFIQGKKKKYVRYTSIFGEKVCLPEKFRAGQ